MNISLDSVSRGAPPQNAAGAVHVPPEEKPAAGWKAHAVGVAELAKVAGEENVDEKALRRDDALGKLMTKAFDPATAAVAVMPLSIGAGE